MEISKITLLYRFEKEYGSPKNVEILNAPLLDISSTYIRNCIQQKKSIQYLVTEPVFNEIERNNYYK